MKLKIAERKNTTKKALESTQALIDSLNEIGFSSDVDTVKSEEFFARCERCNNYNYGDYNYREWENRQAKFKIDGKLSMVSVESDDCSDNDATYLKEIEYYYQINFSDMVKCLEEVIQKHNDLCAKKDAQIEEFLAFCESWNK